MLRSRSARDVPAAKTGKARENAQCDAKPRSQIRLPAASDAKAASQFRNKGLLARKLRRRGVENTRARDLGGDQEGRDHGRNADKSEELINRKHVRRPPKIGPAPAGLPINRLMSESDRNHLLALTRQNPVGNHRSGDRQQRQDRYDRDGLHMVNVDPDCGRKRQSFVPFRDKAGI